jgi:hypothetical protein
MPEIKLPNSKLKVRIGVMNVVPHYKPRGIYPDPITPTLQDKLKVKILNYNGFFKTLKHIASKYHNNK